MFLRNYDNIMALYTLPHSNDQTDTSAFTDGILNVKKMNGNIRGLRYGLYSYSFLGRFCQWEVSTSRYIGSLTNEGPGSGMVRLISGSGTTPVSYDDYNLSNGFTNNQVQRVRGVMSDPIYNSETKKWVSTYEETVLAKENIVLNEIGIMAAAGGTNSANNDYEPCLIYRTVLDSPVNIPKDANFKIKLTFAKSANPNEPVQVSANVE